VIQTSKINKLHATAHFVRTCFSKYPLKSTSLNTYNNYGYKAVCNQAIDDSRALLVEILPSNSVIITTSVDSPYKPVTVFKRPSCGILN
jgi:hypothetical protein